MDSIGLKSSLLKKRIRDRFFNAVHVKSEVIILLLMRYSMR